MAGYSWDVAGAAHGFNWLILLLNLIGILSLAKGVKISWHVTLFLN